MRHQLLGWNGPIDRRFTYGVSCGTRCCKLNDSVLMARQSPRHGSTVCRSLSRSGSGVTLKRNPSTLLERLYVMGDQAMTLMQQTDNVDGASAEAG